MTGPPIQIQEVLLTEDAIRGKVSDLGARITTEYAGRELILVCVLRGAVVFTADLMRRIDLPLSVDFVHASSYGRGTEPGRVRVNRDIAADIRGKHVLLVDCIIDTGETLDFLLRRYRAMAPASLNAAVLLDKQMRRRVPVPLAYRGFAIPDRFVVGYGLDCAGQFRNLPHVAAIIPPVRPDSF